MKNKAAIALQCELNVKLIAALLFILYSSLIWEYSPTPALPIDCAASIIDYLIILILEKNPLKC